MANTPIMRAKIPVEIHEEPSTKTAEGHTLNSEELPLCLSQSKTFQDTETILLRDKSIIAFFSYASLELGSSEVQSRESIDEDERTKGGADIEANSAISSCK